MRVLERLCAGRGVPEAIRCDNGPELTSQVFVDWCERMAITLRYTQPGKPNQNALIERFNRNYREEVLNSYLFEDLDQVREITYDWLIAYNERVPMTPWAACHRRSFVNNKPPKTLLINCLLDREAYENARIETRVAPIPDYRRSNRILALDIKVQIDLRT